MRGLLSSGALASALCLLPPAGAAAAGFCVEDVHDALWVDCREDVTGVTRRVRVLCRRDPGATLMEAAPVRRLQPGEGRCPDAQRARSLPGKAGIPRNGDDAADAPGAAGD
jgi:hypothetical protein